MKNEDTQNENVVQRTFMLSALERRIKSANLSTKQKFKYPATANMQYGWDGGNGGLIAKDPRAHHGIHSTKITQYVENYYLTRGINPFKVRDRVVAQLDEPKEGMGGGEKK